MPGGDIVLVHRRALIGDGEELDSTADEELAISAAEDELDSTAAGADTIGDDGRADSTAAELLEPLSLEFVDEEEPSSQATDIAAMSPGKNNEFHFHIVPFTLPRYVCFERDGKYMNLYGQREAPCTAQNAGNYIRSPGP